MEHAWKLMEALMVSWCHGSLQGTDEGWDERDNGFEMRTEY